MHILKYAHFELNFFDVRREYAQKRVRNKQQIEVLFENPIETAVETHIRKWPHSNI